MGAEKAKRLAAQALSTWQIEFDRKQEAEARTAATHIQDIAKQLQGGTPTPDPEVKGHVGRNAQGDNGCGGTDENGKVRAWGIYGDDGKPLMTRGDDEWQKALTEAASRDLKAREEKQKQVTAQPKKDEPEHVVVPESSYEDDRFITL
jgi:hypothetical protein